MRKLLTLCLLSTLLIACGGGGGGGSDDAASSPANSSTSSAATQESDQPAPSTPEPTPTPNTGTITLTWTPPSTRADGSSLALTDIGGYEIYYYLDGTPINEGEMVNISNRNTTAYTTPELPAGKYYFAISTYDTAMIYSPLSTPVSAVID
ncbi:fibronectin type III domain-containing protein [Dasania marina]|uniref:fibronectin type III domain-containing protein n=1 Tax=Dasania marina TaxID=471499 RepID=UPI0030DDD817|tara:strand:- start:113019 stop:113471 length:453 start_codon:yes stop_codon:yes gene_type:complete